MTDADGSKKRGMFSRLFGKSGGEPKAETPPASAEAEY
jgi:hypothetical protein